jgi:hypothetical protein
MEYGSCEGLDRHYRCCIVVCLIGRAAILVIMYVEISKTDVIVSISIQLKSRLAKILIFRSVEYLKIQGR